MSDLKPEKDTVFCARFKAIQHPLSECHHGLDHDRLRQLYIELLEQCVGDPLEQARQIVIHEILQSYMRDHQTALQSPAQVSIYQVNLAIRYLVSLIYDLEKNDLNAASKSLETAHKSLQILGDYLNKTPGTTEILA